MSAQKRTSSETLPPVSIQDTFRLSPRALDGLVRAYARKSKESVCVFTGAGVSFTTARYYHTPGWWDLLFALHRSLHRDLSKAELRKRFEALRRNRDPWEVATKLRNKAGDEEGELARKIRRILGWRKTGDRKYRRLPAAQMSGAGTLNAVVAFCSRLRAFRRHPCYEPNPRVRAVITINYDWFLEGGATRKYQGEPFKPVTAKSMGELKGRLPVYHIHGYISHRSRERSEVGELVWTTETYRKAYKPGEFTYERLTDHLGTTPTLFVGVSFEDQLLKRRLAELSKLRQTPQHYALLHAGETPNAVRAELRDIGVEPILYTNHGQVPDLLGHVYKNALPSKGIDVSHEIPCKHHKRYERVLPDDYWRKLLSNKK